MSDHLKNLSQVYLEQIAESAVPGKPAEKLGAVTGIPKADQMSAAERIKKKTAEKKAALEKKHGKKMDDHPEYPNKKYVDEENVDEAMSSYDRNRKRAAQRAAERNAARAAGKTGVVPGVGYVSPRKERETYVDSAGTTRHKSGAKMESLDPVGKEDADVDNDGKKTTSDKYILKRREAIRKAIAAKKKVSEQLGEELVIEISGEEKEVKIKEKKVNNKITINPELKESISEIGGEVLFISEVEVATDPKMQQLQKKQIMLDRQKLAARVQAMQKKKPAPEQAQEELSVDQQMKISQKYNRMTPEQRKAANKKVMGNVPKVAPKKDTRTDAQKMTDAVGKPRMGSSD